MFARLNDNQFKYIIEMMCLYKSVNPDKVVTLSEKSAKEAMNFFNREGRQFAPMLNAVAESGLTIDQLLQKAQDEKEAANQDEEEVDDEEVDDEEVDDVEVDSD